MDKELVTMAIESAINLISNELDSIIHEDLKEEFEQTLVELNLALVELKKA